jgi:hypothetical protein
VFLPLEAAAVALVFQVADVPNINVEPSCREVARRAAPVGDVEACLRSEQRARQQLVQEWRQFSEADKARCLQLTTMGFESTYTELLTCLELQRDARLVREREKGSGDAVAMASDSAGHRGGNAARDGADTLRTQGLAPERATR